ncbi:UvrD-helicase domain-containing protein [Piscinibacter sakaiensis]|uniref:UvrD-helicase domain-containing protein n=1 Tax=Piscinibacter sakaiensis TaxID=1547922 RepID=UPI003729990E
MSLPDRRDPPVRPAAPEPAEAPLAVFDVPLAGVQLVEASAGTGKTWALSALVLRLLLERGLAVQQVLVVTFTEAATAELRERIRARLAEVLDALGRAGGGADDPARRGPAARPTGRGPARLRRGRDLHHPRLEPARAGRRPLQRRPAAAAGGAAGRPRAARGRGEGGLAGRGVHRGRCRRSTKPRCARPGPGWPRTGRAGAPNWPPGWRPAGCRP